MNMPRSVLLLFFCMLMSGCATVVTGTSDTIAVSTTGCDKAMCTLSNQEGEWKVEAPGEVEVDKSAAALTVVCENEDKKVGVSSLPSRTEGWVWGNILIGGLIGLAVDASTDGLYDYSDSVSVPLDCKEPQQQAQVN